MCFHKDKGVAETATDMWTVSTCKLKHCKKQLKMADLQWKLDFTIN